MDKKSTYISSGNTFSLTVYGTAEDCVVTVARMGPCAVFVPPGDGFYPYPEETGYVHVKVLDGRPHLTAMLRQKFWQSSHEVDGLVDAIVKLLVIEVQPAYTVERVVLKSHVILSGEESLEFDVNDDDTDKSFFKAK